MSFTPLKLALPSLMTWNDNKISDHNRSALSVSVDRIETATRMANGTMRKFIVADKRTFSTDWTDLPQSALFTVDGFWGKNEIENWYNTQTGAFTLKLFYGDGTTGTYSVFMSKFSADISKRGVFDFWRVQVEMQEV
jgi:hypothetical protein